MCKEQYLMKMLVAEWGLNRFACCLSGGGSSSGIDEDAADYITKSKNSCAASVGQWERLEFCRLCARTCN